MIILDGVPSSQSPPCSTQAIHPPTRSTEIPTAPPPPSRYPIHRSSFLWNVRTIALMTTTLLSVVPVGLAGRLASRWDFITSPYISAADLTFATGPATFVASLALFINTYLRTPSRRFAEVIVELCILAILSMFWYIIGGLFTERQQIEAIRGFFAIEISCNLSWFDPLSCQLLPAIEALAFTIATLLLIYSLLLLGFTLYAHARGHCLWFCPVYEAEFLAPSRGHPTVPQKSTMMHLTPVFHPKTPHGTISSDGASLSDPVPPPYFA